MRVESPDSEERALYRRVIHAAKQHGLVPVGFHLTHTGRAAGDMIIRLSNDEAPDETDWNRIRLDTRRVTTDPNLVFAALEKNPAGLEVTTASVPRALDLIRGLAAEARRRGHRVGVNTKTKNPSVYLQVDKTRRRVRLIEEYDEVPHVPTDEEARKLRRNRWLVLPRATGSPPAVCGWRSPVLAGTRRTPGPTAGAQPWRNASLESCWTSRPASPTTRKRSWPPSEPMMNTSPRRKGSGLRSAAAGRRSSTRPALRPPNSCARRNSDGLTTPGSPPTRSAPSATPSNKPRPTNQPTPTTAPDGLRGHEPPPTASTLPAATRSSAGLTSTSSPSPTTYVPLSATGTPASPTASTAHNATSRPSTTVESSRHLAPRHARQGHLVAQIAEIGSGRPNRLARADRDEHGPATWVLRARYR